MGIEKLRQIYATSGLSIRPKTRVSKIDALKEIIRARGLNPEQILTRETLSQGAILHVGLDTENRQLQILTNTLRDLVRHEATEATVQIRSSGGGPAGI